MNDESGPNPAAVSRRPKNQNRRTKRTTIRYSENELASIKKASATWKLSPISYIADAALSVACGVDSPGAIAHKREAMVELMRTRNKLVKVGTVLNQMAARLNSGGSVPEPLDATLAKCREAIEELESAAEDVRRQIVQRR